MQDSFDNDYFNYFPFFAFNFNRHFFTFQASRSYRIYFVTGYSQ